MGYDIYTIDADAQLAEKFARDYGYGYMFNQKVTIEQMTGQETMTIPADAKYEGDGRVYFRANIWGMGELRQWVAAVHDFAHKGEDNEAVYEAYGTLLKKISFNDGEVITPEEIDMLFNDAGKLDNTQTNKIYEMLDGKPQLLDEWIDFLTAARKLGGAQVW